MHVMFNGALKCMERELVEKLGMVPLAGIRKIFQSFIHIAWKLYSPKMDIPVITLTIMHFL